MRKFILLYSLFFSYQITAAQSSGKTKEEKPFRSLEITAYLNFNTYPQFSYSTNSSSHFDVNIKGTSLGIQLAYSIPLSSSIYIKPLIGFYRYAFNDIDQFNSAFQTRSKGRITNLNLSPGILKLYSSDKYFYKTVDLGFAVEKKIDLSKHFEFSIGAQLHNYFTFSQSYHIYTDDPISNPYKTSRTDYFGTTGNLSIGIVKRGERINFGPQIIFPVISTWKTDAVFYGENNDASRSKWLRGIGIGFSVSYNLQP